MDANGEMIIASICVVERTLTATLRADVHGYSCCAPRRPGCHDIGSLASR
jgi:hypothetical protein